MARTTKVSDTFATAYPNVARWVREEDGWIELGSDGLSSSFIRALNTGGLIWEGADEYPTIDAAFADADVGIADWLEEDAAPAKKAPAAKKPTSSTKKAATRLVPVESSMLSAIGYDEATEELVAVFTSGAIWHYRGVPKKVYRQLLASSSKGGYMRDLIIGQYPEYRGGL